MRSSPRLTLATAAVAVTVLLGSSPLVAQSSSTTQPADRVPDRIERMGGIIDRRSGNEPGQGAREGGWRRGDAPRAAAAAASAAAAPPLTEEERREIEQFIRTHSPRRWQKLSDVADERKQRFVEVARPRYRMLQRLRQDDPELYDIRMKRLPIEDSMFALGWELKRDDPKNEASVRQQLSQQIRLFVDSQFEERKLRLDRVRQRLRQQQEALDQDQALLDRDVRDVAALVDKGIAAIENERGAELRDLGAAPPRGGAGRQPPAPSATAASPDESGGAPASAPAPSAAGATEGQ